MSDERGTHRDPARRSGRLLLWAVIVIVVLAVAWWLIEFTGNNAERDLDDTEIEPLQPAAVVIPGPA